MGLGKLERDDKVGVKVVINKTNHKLIIFIESTCARHCARNFVISLNLYSNHMRWVLLLSCLQMRKWRLWEVIKPAKSYPASVLKKRLGSRCAGLCFVAGCIYFCFWYLVFCEVGVRSWLEIGHFGENRHILPYPKDKAPNTAGSRATLTQLTEHHPGLEEDGIFQGSAEQWGCLGTPVPSAGSCQW